MCAQGSSGGSSAVAYSLIQYGASSYLNNAELLSGPTFSDIEMGCAIPQAQNVNICSGNQHGCSPGTLSEVQQAAWIDSPLYVYDWLNAVQSFTGDPTCNAGQNTSQPSDNAWKAQSILTGPNGPPVSLTGLGMGAWLCYCNVNCDPNKGCPNNSAAEGQQLYQWFTSLSNSPKAYLLTGIQQCNRAGRGCPGHRSRRREQRTDRD